jgi:hypothetical protein
VPVAIRIPAALQSFDIVQILVRTLIAKIVGDIQFALMRLGVIRLAANLGTAFLALQSAVRALKDFANGLDLAFSN